LQKYAIICQVTEFLKKNATARKCHKNWLKLGISGQIKEGKYNDKSIIHLPRQYFPELKKACKMGVSGAKEVKFNTGLPLLQEEKI